MAEGNGKVILLQAPKQVPDVAQFPLNFQIEIQTDMLKAGNELDVRLFFNQVTEAVHTAIRDKLETIRLELNKLDPVTIRPPMDSFVVDEKEEPKTSNDPVRCAAHQGKEPTEGKCDRKFKTVAGFHDHLELYHKLTRKPEGDGDGRRTDADPDVEGIQERAVAGREGVEENGDGVHPGAESGGDLVREDESGIQPGGQAGSRVDL